MQMILLGICLMSKSSAAQYDAIDRIVGRLFARRRRSQSGGGSGAGASLEALRGRAASGGARHRKASVSRMKRAGGFHGKAVFKLIRSGGTQSRAGLKGQLSYIFNEAKLARTIDPSGRTAPDGRPTNAAMNRLTHEWSNTWWKNTRNGNTSHIILSYPGSVSIADVETITRAVCNEMFETGDRTFDYICALHDDTEHHPHAHIIVNRRGSDNTLFNMRSGTEHSYEGFRESMAAHAGRIGIQLDPTFAFERGDTRGQPSLAAEVHARETNTRPVRPELTGPELAYRQEQISYSQIAYNALAVIAANSDNDRLATAYMAFSETLDTLEGDFIMPELSQDELQRFDDYTAVLNDTIERTEKLLETKSPADRVPLEERLSAIMVAFTALQSDASYARDLHTPANRNSIYSANIVVDKAFINDPTAIEAFREMDEAFGLDGKAIAQRLQVADRNMYLEQIWLKDDITTVAAKYGYDLSVKADVTEAINHVDHAYAELRDNLIFVRAIVEPEVERPEPVVASVPDHAFEAYRERSRTDDAIARSAYEHDDLIKVLKEHTTLDQYNRLAQGDLGAVSHITTDETFAKHLLKHVALNEFGMQRSDFPEATRQLVEAFDRELNERDDERGRER